MSKKVFVDSHNLLSPLGKTSAENFIQLKNGNSGVQQHFLPVVDHSPFWAAVIDEKEINSLSESITSAGQYTRFEKLLIGSVAGALKNTSIDITDPKTIFIISTTKGNISLLEQQSEVTEKLSLAYSGNVVSNYFKNPNKPVIISNACISGVVALLYAKRLLASGQYENAVIAGADTFNRFVFSGFKAFHALSANACKPFSLNRDGINLGEAAATIILTTNKIRLPDTEKIELKAGAISNDANHISGPSRTGEELSAAINKTLLEAQVSGNHVDFISAHGTATLFNDEMEAKAFCLSHLQQVPVNSLKGYFGHTLGASGVVESVISILSLKENVILPTYGFSGPGLPDINVCSKAINKPMRHCLKTASGFGGGNAAILFSKL